MSCNCGAQSMEECSTLGELLAEQLGGAVGADESWADLILTSPKWKTLARTSWCLLHPRECIKDAKPSGIGTGFVLFLLLAYGYWKLKDR